MVTQNNAKTKRKQEGLLVEGLLAQVPSKQILTGPCG